jgi:ATP-dependent helicase HrpA
LASRLAEELGTTVGGAVGYKVRFNDRSGPNCQVKLMTDGILLKELESDRLLRRYDTLIIDEAHERSLNIDLLLGVIKRLVPKRPDLRVIVTSATIDPGRFSTFFDGAPVIEVSGRSHPVEVRYRALVSDGVSSSGQGESAATGADDDDDSATAEGEDARDLSLPEGIVEAVRELDRTAGALSGDTLVFLPGEKQIREAADELEKARLPHTEILPLFARLSAKDQERIFQRHAARRVILATNVAETSLTVPGIRYVIDSGLARISRYSVRGKVQRLPIEGISKASADQRKGRCGREAEGICIRLYSEADFTLREDFTPPEVLRTNLASVILRMATIGLGEPESFPFLDPPDTRLVNDGVRLLQELKAMDDARQVTSLGRKISGLPVDPRLGRMLLAASHHSCLTEMLAITAFLEAQDPRERPRDAQQQSAQKHALFADERSDFITVLNLWRAFNEQSAALSGNQLRKWCREHFLSFLRMREWQELHSQLSEAVRELELKPNSAPASYGDLHQAILTGFLGSIGSLDEKREYDGPRGMRFVIAPGTPLASKPPKWVAAGSLVETSRVYARMVASVNPMWIEQAGAHLVKRIYSEAHWVATGGYVGAFETVSLYGLTLASRRRVNYGQVQPLEARDVFIREALVNEGDGLGAVAEQEEEDAEQLPLRVAHDAPRRERGRMRRDGREDTRGGIVGNGHGGGQSRGDGRGRDGAHGGSGGDGRGRGRGDPRGREPVRVGGDFLAANRALRKDIGHLEAKIRRRDILVDEQAEVDFYAARLPERVNSVALFDRWRGEAERAAPRLLFMTRSDAMRREAPDAAPDRFPDEIEVGRNRLPLSYVFEPSEPNDGITLTVPVELLDTLQPERLAWVVPGMRLEKIAEIFRALPKSQRKLLVPVPEHAKEALSSVSDNLPPFYTWLSEWVTARVGSHVTPTELASLELPPYLRMNIRVVDAKDRVVAEGRDLAALKRRVFGVGAAVGAGGIAGAAGGGPGVAAGVGARVGGDAGSRGAPQTPTAEAVHREWDFGNLAESVEVNRNRLRLVVYPAVEDAGSGVRVVEARNGVAAEAVSRRGLTRLALLALPQQVKFVSKRFSEDRELTLLSSGLSLTLPLAEGLTQRTFRDCLFPQDGPLPRTQAEFTRLLDQRRGDLSEVADRLASLMLLILREWRAARVALDGLKTAAFAETVSDVKTQMSALLPPTFIEATSRPWLEYLPRYLKAITRRLERAGGNVKRDAELATKVKPFTTAFRALAAQPVASAVRPELEQLRWMIEEFRVSLFAQELRTMVKVSEKRLAEQIEAAKAEANA